MKKIVLGISLIALASFCGFAKSRTGGVRGASAVETDTLHSTVLGAPREFTVYLPAGYDTDTTRSYPVLYLLHGFSDTNQSWFHNAPLATVADRLIASGEVQPMIIVSPNAGGTPGVDWNGYFDMPGWNYETFMFTEFIPYIESNYRVKPGKEHRAISGLSMGGGGCASYAQRHPDMFSSAYVMSGWLHNEKAENVDAADKVAVVRRSVADHSCLGFLENADAGTADSLRSLAWYVDVGDDDFLLDINQDFYRLMRKKRIPCQLRVRDGSHNWEYWTTALYTSLPFASRNFK
ncbi:MAG: esterase family protein [Muribaculaceae bacterium]|nr:esterase family protein [Muribaculaceae bacterium]